MPSSRIHIQESFQCQEELQDPWQRTPVCHTRPGRVETHYGRNQTHHRDPEQQPEPHILLGLPEPEPPASMLVPLPVQVLLLTHPQTWATLCKTGCSLT